MSNIDGYEYFQEMTENGLVNIPEDKMALKATGKELYRYTGPVKQFGKVVMDNFETSTLAVSKKKAINNIIYSAKIKLGLNRTAGGFTLVNDVVKD